MPTRPATATSSTSSSPASAKATATENGEEHSAGLDGLRRKRVLLDALCLPQRGKPYQRGGRRGEAFQSTNPQSDTCRRRKQAGLTTVCRYGVMSKMFFNTPAPHAPRRSHGLTTLRLAVTTESPAEYGRIATP